MCAAIRELQQLGNNQIQMPPIFGGGAAAECLLKPFALDENYIGITWGIICGLQPDGFYSGGFPVYKIGYVGTDGFIYAVSVADLTTLQWTEAGFIVSETVKSNTTTTAYTLKGSYHKDSVSGLLSVEGTCGNVDVDICTLLPA
jgi:hypothetical protein